MPNLEIDRCELTIAGAPPIRRYGWVFRGTRTYYSLPFSSGDEQDRFVALLTANLRGVIVADEADTLAALLSLYRGGDDAASNCANDHLDKEFAHLLPTVTVEELDDMTGRLLSHAWSGEIGGLAGPVSAPSELTQRRDEALGLGVVGLLGDMGENQDKGDSTQAQGGGHER